MKITIEAETTQESEQLKTPFIRTDVGYLLFIGKVGADAVSFRSAGDLIEMLCLTTRMEEEIRAELNRKTATAGVVDAHNMIAKAQQDAAAIAAVGDLHNGRGLRIHRP